MVAYRLVVCSGFWSVVAGQCSLVIGAELRSMVCVRVSRRSRRRYPSSWVGVLFCGYTRTMSYPFEERSLCRGGDGSQSSDAMGGRMVMRCEHSAGTLRQAYMLQGMPECKVALPGWSHTTVEEQDALG